MNASRKRGLPLDADSGREPVHSHTVAFLFLHGTALTIEGRADSYPRKRVKNATGCTRQDAGLAPAPFFYRDLLPQYNPSMTMAHIHTVKLSAEQYLQLGEDPPGVHLELIDGEVIVSPSPSRSHAEIIVALVYLLQGHIRKTGLGKLYLDTDVIFTGFTVRRPDIAFFGRGKLSQLSGGLLCLPPDLCVEVLSPSNEDDDRINKFQLYQSTGVSHYWIIDPEARSMEAYVLAQDIYQPVGVGRDAEVVQFPPFLDLAIPLAELWTNLS
jgi:Uma2 family endonuclease